MWKRALLGSFLTCAALSQDPPAFRSQVELVAIPCAVVDLRGAAVYNLNREDFRVFDNDVPRIVSYFSRDDDHPLTLGILIDDSDSQSELVEEHRRTALDLAAPHAAGGRLRVRGSRSVRMSGCIAI